MFYELTGASPGLCGDSCETLQGKPAPLPGQVLHPHLSLQDWTYVWLRFSPRPRPGTPAPHFW